MKLLTAAILSAAALSLLSCAGVDPVRRFPGMVADMDPIPVGSVDAALDRPIGRGLNVISVDVVFHPRLNSVALEFRHEFVTYRQFWDEPARRHFAVALENYLADFDARNLVNRHRQTRNAYGRVSGRLEWQTARFTVNHVAYPTIEIGYRFRENAPFFATLMRSARSEETQGAGAGRIESRQLNMYFTRAQAGELAAMFDQSNLMALLGMHAGVQRPETAAPVWDSFPMDGDGAESDGEFSYE